MTDGIKQRTGKSIKPTTHSSSETIGLIGVGLLGTALAERLISGGYNVVGFDRNAERMSALNGLGGVAVESAEAVARASSRVMLSLPTSDVSESVLEMIEEQLAPGNIVIDTTTGSPETMAALGRQLSDRGVDYLDATVGGSSDQARRGDVIVMAGSPVEAFESCRDVFNTFAKQSFRVGDCGAGAKMKLVTNLVLGLTRAVLAEGLTLAGALELDLATSLEVLQAGPAASRPMETKGHKMLAGDFTPQARLSQHLKDVRLVLGAASQCGVPVPLSHLHERLLSIGEANGDGELDNSAVMRVFDYLSPQVQVNLTS